MQPFLLNETFVAASAETTRMTLEWLREEVGLTAAKAACQEGGCGACGVLLGALESPGRVRYRLVNSCLLPLAAVGGHHLITLEGLSRADGDLTPVQQALLDEGAVQCGFCTPGMVMALTHWLINGRRFDREEALEALDGAFCRCTGYQSIRRAAARLASLGATLSSPDMRLAELVRAGVLPDYLLEIPSRLARLPPPARGSRLLGGLIVAGGTDLFEHPRAEPLTVPMLLISERPELRGIRLADGRCRIGAATTIEELLESSLLEAHIPHLHAILTRIAGTPIRDRATIGGNLVNASPIGDLSVCLLALEAELMLQGPQGERQLPLSRFFLGYKTLDLEPEELVSAVEFKLTEGPTLFSFEKVAHREHLDIASVNSALHLELADGRIRHAALSAGGVAPTPLWLGATSAWLSSRELTADTLLEAATRAAAETRPIDDVRGSAAYKRLLLGRLVMAHFIKLAPEALRDFVPRSEQTRDLQS